MRRSVTRRGVTLAGGKRRGVRLAAVAAAPAVMATAMLAGCTAPSAQPKVNRALDTQTPAAAPIVVRDCWVPTSAGNVSMTGEEARALTTRAARLGRHTRNPDRIVERLQPAVHRTLPSAPADDAGVSDRADLDPGVAREIAAGLTGVRARSRLVCAYARTSVQPQRPGPSGLVPRARQLRAEWTEVFGSLPAGGFAPGGVHSGHVDGSAHYEGRAIDVFFRPLGDREQHRRGWVFAQWLVAHAPDHHVLSVIYDDHIWTSWGAYAGWRDYVHPGATFQRRGNPVLRHREHVHVAVESGRPFTRR